MSCELIINYTLKEIKNEIFCNRFLFQLPGREKNTHRYSNLRYIIFIAITLMLRLTGDDFYSALFR
jgi:hypothetical protein